MQRRWTNSRAFVLEREAATRGHCAALIPSDPGKRGTRYGSAQFCGRALEGAPNHCPMERASNLAAFATYGVFAPLRDEAAGEVVNVGNDQAVGVESLALLVKDDGQFLADRAHSL